MTPKHVYFQQAPLLEKQLGKRGMDQADRAQGPGTWPTCHLDAGTWMNFQAGSHTKGLSDGLPKQEARAW